MHQIGEARHAESRRCLLRFSLRSFDLGIGEVIDFGRDQGRAVLLVQIENGVYTGCAERRKDIVERCRGVTRPRLTACGKPPSRSGVLPDGAAPLRAQMDDLQQRVAGLASQEQSAAATSDRTARLARLQSASAALAAGIKLGPIPGAPSALTRFAASPPPTEAALRLAFPTVMREAATLTTPDTEGKPFLDRVLARLADYRLITVREGDRVVIGNATVETLEQARASLNAGDLAGAVRLTGGISGPPQSVIAPWLADAKALLAARAALAEALAALAGNG